MELARLMAAPSVFFIVLSLVLAPAAGADTHLHFYLHDVVTGSNPTAVQVIKGPSSGTANPVGNFGDTLVIDDLLTDGPDGTSAAAIGRAQGFYMFSSRSGSVLMMCINVLFTTGDYNGSTLAVIGRDDIMASERELSVVGGTGQFRMAKGYVLWKTSSMNGPSAVIDLNVYVSTPNETIATTTPTTPVGGSKGADGGGVGASTGSASSVARPVHAWVRAFLGAVVVALVGCVW